MIASMLDRVSRDVSGAELSTSSCLDDELVVVVSNCCNMLELDRLLECEARDDSYNKK